MAPGSNTPVAWTIAGSDSGGGAGIQADLKVFNAFGVHGCSAIAALTAQNTLGVTRTEPVSEAMFRSQLDALTADLPPAAIKTGMLGNAANCRILAELLAALPPTRPWLVCDPVLKSTSGTCLLEPDALTILVRNLFPRTDLLTPNVPETRILLGTDGLTVEKAAHRLLDLGVRSVCIKGGHTDGAFCRDYWTDGTQSLWLSSPRLDTRATHGTGCILASAAAAALALGQPLPDALTTAKTFLNQCLQSPANLGAGHGPMKIEPFRNHPSDRPDIFPASAL